MVTALLVGCGGGPSRWQTTAIRAASMDHNCPEPNVALTQWDRVGPTATAVMDVCGERRVYRDFGGPNTVMWQDVTNTTR